MPNAFDQFDTATNTATQANPFDQFDTGTTAAGAFGRAAATSVVPSFGALGGAEAGATAGALIPVLGETGIGEIGGALVGALVGSLLADKAQNKVIQTAAPNSYATLQKYQQEDLKNHPVATALGNLAGGIPAFRFGNPVQTARGAAAIYKIATGDAVTAAERQAAKNVATQLGVGTAAGVAAPLIQGQKPTAGEITQSIAQTLLFGSARFGGKVPEGVTDVRQPTTKESEAPNASSQRETTGSNGNRGTPPGTTIQPQQGTGENVPQAATRVRVNEGLEKAPEAQPEQVSPPRGSGTPSPQGNVWLKPALLVDGKPITGGNTHAEIFQNIIKNPATTPDMLDKISDAQGDDSKHVFVDGNGDVLSRKQAAPLFETAGGKLSNPLKGLTSEDLLSQPAVAQNIKPPEKAPAKEQVQQWKDVGKDEGFTFDAQFKGADKTLLQFTYRKLPAGDPAQGATFYAYATDSPEQILAKARAKATQFREAAKTEQPAAPPATAPVKPAPSETPAPQPAAAPMRFGPGAQTAGEPEYPAISHLADQINTAEKAPAGPAQKFNVAQQLTDAWARGKTVVQQALANTLPMRAALRGIARGVRTPTDLDQRLGSLDRVLQTSVGRSMAAGKAMKTQVPNQAMRDAAMLWLDTGGDEGKPLLEDALKKLPQGTSPRVRRAIETAINLPEPSRNLANHVKEYYQVRGDEALNEGVVNRLLEDYATHIWKNENNTPQQVKDAISNGRISTYFKFGRQRSIGNFIDGILAGKTPELDPANILPYYNYHLDRAIASRQFVKDASETMTEKDGRPTFAPSGVRTEVPKEGATEATLLKPRGKGFVAYRPGGPGSGETPEEEAQRLASMQDYKEVDHPAMRKWKWFANDANGKPIYYQADLLVHPDAHERIARIMDKGRLTPTKAGRMALAASTQIKGFKLGLFSLFHPVHVGSHALFHWTNPFKQIRGGDLDFDSPDVGFALEKGHLKLAPSEHELNNFADGVLNNKLLIQKIPFIGTWSRANAEWTFKQFIPKLKVATFLNAYRRNIWARDNMPASVTGLKGLSDDEIASRVGDSVNNAYGELNHWFLGKQGRDPRFQRLLRGIFLAPDFGEARLRFVTKAATKTGFEERMALATMFTTLYLGARVANMLANGDPQTDWKHAFEVKVGNHWWGMRSVIGDMNRMFADSGRFMYVRLNPLYARPLYDWLVGRDPSGMKLTTTQKLVTRPLQQLVPIQLGGLTRPDQETWESFVTAMGLQTTRDYPQADVDSLIDEFKRTSKDPKLQAEWKRSQQETFGQSDYAGLRYALILDNAPKAFQEYQKLIQQQGKTRGEIFRALSPNAPLTHSAKLEVAFKKSLDAEGMKKYNAAKEQQRQVFESFKAMLNEFKNSGNPYVAPAPQDAAQQQTGSPLSE